jgi:hypothetical protein
VAARSKANVAPRLLVLWVRIAPGTWMLVSCGCCVLLGRGPWDGPITRPEQSYTVWCARWVWMWSQVTGGHDLESGRRATRKKPNKYFMTLYFVLRVSSFPHLRLLHRLLKTLIVINRHDEAIQFQQNSARNYDRFVIYFKRNIFYLHCHKIISAHNLNCLALQVPISSLGCCLGWL